MLCAFSGCSDKSEAEEPSASTAPAYTGTGIATPEVLSAEVLGDTIFTSLTFDDTLTKIQARTSAVSAYGLPEDYKGDCIIYVSTGATPEEFAVFVPDEACSADDIVKAANDRIARQTETYSSYAPEQVPKLESAVVKSNGSYVVVCISADNDTAKTLIDDCI